MPDWGEVLQEISQLQAAGNPAPLDAVRRKYIASQRAHSGRALIVYATKWTQPNANVPPQMIAVSDTDIQGLMEVLHRVPEQDLDLILHSPGGSLAAADAFVKYLRSKFRHIRAFIPQAAMSAATMIACAADEIHMGKHSSLGPIDPQLIMQTQLGPRTIPAQAILDQFEMARKECANPANLAVWLPMLQQYGPDLLVQCRNVCELSERFVGEWLARYMFAGHADAADKANRIADWLGDHGVHKMHGKYLSRDQLREKGLNVRNLEDDEAQQDFILSIFHATTHTFMMSAVVKLIENHLGRAYMEVAQIVVQGAPANAPIAP